MFKHFDTHCRKLILHVKNELLQCKILCFCFEVHNLHIYRAFKTNKLFEKSIHMFSLNYQIKGYIFYIEYYKSTFLCIQRSRLKVFAL